MDQEFDQLLQKACSTPQGSLKATLILGELQKLAPAFADEGTREAAVEALTKWSDIGGDPLRKGMAMAWLARARATLAPHVAEALSGAGKGVQAVRDAAGAAKAGVEQAKGAVTGAYAAAQNKAGDLGAAAGDRIANSRLGATRMAEIRAKGGAKAQARMAERMKPQGHVQPFYQEEAAAGPRLEAGGGGDAHGDALAAAFRAGADHAAGVHAKASARIGRIAARHAFRAGAMLGAAGAGVAAAGTLAGHLSEKQHEQRVEAGRHSHQGSGARGGL